MPLRGRDVLLNGAELLHGGNKLYLAGCVGRGEDLDTKQNGTYARHQPLLRCADPPGGMTTKDGVFDEVEFLHRARALYIASRSTNENTMQEW